MIEQNGRARFVVSRHLFNYLRGISVRHSFSVTHADNLQAVNVFYFIAENGNAGIFQDIVRFLNAKIGFVITGYEIRSFRRNKIGKIARDDAGAALGVSLLSVA